MIYFCAQTLGSVASKLISTEVRVPERVKYKLFACDVTAKRGLIRRSLQPPSRKHVPSCNNNNNNSLVT